MCGSCQIVVEIDLYTFKHSVYIVLYRGYVIVAETVSRLTFHGSKDTSGDGKVRLFAQFVVVVCFNI